MAGALKRITRLAINQPELTPQIRRWLAHHPEGVMVETQDELEFLGELLVLKKGTTRAGAFHPSGLLQCSRRQVFAFHGTEADPGTGVGPQLQNIFNDGSWRHARWQLMLYKMGVIHTAEVPVRIESQRLTGSMDGQGTSARHGDEFFLELKGTSKNLNDLESSGPLEDHTFQVQAYLLASGLPRAIVIYEHKSHQDFIELEVLADSDTQGEILSILEGLNAHIDNDTLPPVLPGCWAQEGEEFSNCPYATHCLNTERAA